MPGPHGELYGIFTPPAPEISPNGLCVILLARNRWWVDRLAVKGARWLASRGFASLRFDYHGYGESEGPSASLETEKPYREDVIATIRFMRKAFGQRRFVLSGFCFDGRTALATVEEEGASIEAIVAIAAPPGEKLTHLTLSKVTAFLRMPVWAKMPALRRALRRRLHPFFPHLISHPERGDCDDNDFAPPLPVSESFEQDIRAVVRFGVRCLFLTGRYDAEFFNFELVKRSTLAKLDPAQRALFTFETWPTRIHVPHDPQLQREVMERALSWIDGLRQQPTDMAWTASHVGAPEITNELALGTEP
jgi:pimeloyl-ACP methyl ester carboxylesterase